MLKKSNTTELRRPVLQIPAHNLKAAGSNPAPATNLSVVKFDCLKNLTANQQGLNDLAVVLAELGRRLQEVSSIISPQPAVHAPHAGMKLVDLVNEMLMAKAVKGVREKYLTQLYYSLLNFSDGRERRPIDSFTPAEIEEWSLDKKWVDATRRSHLTNVRTLFSWAVKREYLVKSPMDPVELPMLEDTPANVHAPAEVENFLHVAQGMDKDIMRLMAVQYFAGLRPMSEAAKLDERNIMPGLIEVLGPKCKTRQRRLVKIQPALKAFLDVGGELPVKNLKRRWLAVREKAGIKWAPDVTRDSFCSYHLAHFKKASLTARQSGHSEDVLHSRYVSIRTLDGQLITDRLAKEFWGIRPY
jgi:hypothetical protein